MLRKRQSADFGNIGLHTIGADININWQDIGQNLVDDAKASLIKSIATNPTVKAAAVSAAEETLVEKAYSIYLKNKTTILIISGIIAVVASFGIYKAFKK